MDELRDMQEISRRAIARFGENRVLQAIRDRAWSRAAYERLLLNIHYQVFQGSMSFALAAGNLPSRLAVMREFLVQHAADEMGHHEWILDDLKTIGYSGPHPRDLLPTPEALAYVSFNVANAVQMPAARIASSTVLEGLATQLRPEDVSAAFESVGQGAEAFSFFLKHAETDKTHIRQLWDVIGDSPLSPDEWRWMKHSAATAGVFYTAMYDGSV